MGSARGAPWTETRSAGKPTAERRNAGTGRIMRLSVAANFDDRLLERIAGYPVFEVYGKLPSDLIGGGRASVMLGPVSRRRLQRHIETAHRHGIQFHSPLNAACLDNMELTRGGRRRIRRLLRWRRDLDVDALAVASPFLLKFAQEHFLPFKLRASLFAEADHVLNVSHWSAMGADSIPLNSPFVNRELGDPGGDRAGRGLRPAASRQP